MTGSLRARLDKAAQDLALHKQEASIRESVARFVRLNRSFLIELHETLGTWSAVAGLLADEGLCWRNGNTVSGDQIRSLVSRTKPRSRPASPQQHQANRTGLKTSLLPRSRAERSAEQASPQSGTRGLADFIDT